MSFSNVLMFFSSNFVNVQCRFYCLVLAIRLMRCWQFNTNRQTCCMTRCMTRCMTCYNMFERFAPSLIFALVLQVHKLFFVFDFHELLTSANANIDIFQLSFLTLSFSCDRIIVIHWED